jgi:hypothetical protein
MWCFCDDKGTHPSDTKTLKMECFPGDDDVTSAMIREWLDELIRAKLLVEFDNGDSRYLHVTGWKHQRIDKPQAPRHPLPGDEDSRIVPRTVQEPIQERSGSDSKNVLVAFPPEGKEGRKEGILRIPGMVPEPAELPFVTLPVVGGEEYPVTDAQVAEWRIAFPAVDVPQKLRAMRQWLLANPNRRKTPRGVLRFVVAWLERDQNRGGSKGGNGAEDIFAGAK